MRVMFLSFRSRAAPGQLRPAGRAIIGKGGGSSTPDVRRQNRTVYFHIMVTYATSSATLPPRLPVPPSALNGRGALVRFTVRDMRAMLEQGVIPEDATTELLHGVIVLKDRSDRGDEPTVHGTKHRKCVSRLAELGSRIDSSAQHVQTQLPLICGDDEAPEPDFAVVRGTVDTYDAQLPTGRDATCVVEAADSSLERDVEEKVGIYAVCGVPQYVVLNLRDRAARLYTDPDPSAAAYRSVSILPETADLHLLLPSGSPFVVRVADLLP
jgi:hypothetical protein